MSKEFAKKVFVPFERERTSTVSGIQGTGLGMAISSSIIQLMGGNIEVFSEQEKGTEFRIHLSFPLGHEEADEEKETTGSMDFTDMHVLLAEDNLINREIATMIMTQAGFIVDSAANGQIAVDKVRASNPGEYDVILMPTMYGYTAAREIGMQVHVSKPINVDTLMQTLSSVLQQKSEKTRITGVKRL